MNPALRRTVFLLIGLCLPLTGWSAPAPNISLPETGKELLAACKQSHPGAKLHSLSEAARAGYCLGIAHGMASMLSFVNLEAKDPGEVRRCVPGDSTGTDFAKEVIRQFELDPSLAEMDNASAAVIIATLQAYRCP